MTVPYINSVLGRYFGTANNNSGKSGSGAKTSDSDYTHQWTDSANGGYFSNGSSSWIYCYKIPKSLKKVVITNQTEIPDNAFRNCDLIEEGIIGKEVECAILDSVTGFIREYCYGKKSICVRLL